jgi:tetratricopeptide (TPR) repeat protein
MNSFREAETAMEHVEAAANLDPGLHLYTLQAAYLTGQAALQSANPDWEAAAQAYREALAIEPTWDTGWINLAAIELRQGNPSAALSHLDMARKTNVHNLASVHWAELAEAMSAAPDEAIVEAYVDAIEASVFLPAADYWWATDLRRAAVERYLANQPIDIQYRVYAAHDPTSARRLIAQSPATAPEWWVAGEYALTVDLDPEKAAANFSRAIELDPINGDYYVSRARAVWESDIQAAKRDLDIAGLLGTTAESINAVQAEIQTDPEERNRLRANALPPKVVLQEFAAVLYGRPAVFDVFPEMQRIGPGRAAMQPWYALAEDYLARGENEKAIRVYLSILEYAPDEQEARERLQHF